MAIRYWADVVHLDRPKRLLVVVSTGWNKLRGGELLVKGVVRNVRFQLKDALSTHSQGDDGTR